MTVVLDTSAVLALVAAGPARAAVLDAMTPDETWAASAIESAKRFRRSIVGSASAIATSLPPTRRCSTAESSQSGFRLRGARLAYLNATTHLRKLS